MKDRRKQIMKIKRIASLLLAFLLFAGTFSSFASVNVSADGEDTSTETGGEKPDGEEETETGTDIDYTKIEYKTAEEKIKSMTLRVENDNFQLYSFSKTGEIALLDKRTGQTLFSNPYDIATTKSSDDTKEELLSQLIVLFETGDGKSQEYFSYTEAALRDQITVKNIKDGLRVEYAMGRTETRKLVPRMITKERYETVLLPKIKASASAYELTKFEAFYVLKDASLDLYKDEKARNDLYLQFPITKKYAVYVIGSDTKEREYNELEAIIKKYVPEYTYEEMEYDHDLTEYTVTATAPPLFRMAIEYKLETTGVSATLAANSISFDESSYKLTSVTLLPFFGAGNYKEYKGYTLMPDGSGTLTRFEDMASSSTSVNIKSKVYGQDFAYHTNEPKHRQTIRLPIYGIVENIYDEKFALVTVDRKYYYTESGEPILRNEMLEGWFTPEGQLNKSIVAVSRINRELYNSKGELVWMTPGIIPDGTTVKAYDENNNAIDSIPENGIFYLDLPDSSGKPTGTLKKATSTLPEDGKYYNAEGELCATKKLNEMKYCDKDGNVVSENEAPEDMVYRDSWGQLITTMDVSQKDINKEDKGYFAILTEGASLADIMTTSGGAEHDYASIYTTFYPRPTDKYNLSDASSAGSNMMWTVTSKRKYTGNYTIKYYMLTDETKAEEYIEYLKNPTTEKKDGEDGEEEGVGFTPLTKDTDFADTYYKANYMGMVNACRDYFEENNILSRFTAEEVNEDIPLIIETLGAITSTKRILSVPVTVKLPLTTFDDIQSMNEALKTAGITNVTYKLNGFANGGMTSTVPYKLKWEKSVGGASGFEELMEYANANNVGVYPDFDFSYVGAVANFDGFSYKKHAVKTMDNRYISKREYDPAFQTFSNTFYDPISPSVFEYFYDKMSPKLLKYKPTGISSATLGSDLNSDFDKKDPYNRENSKEFVTQLLEKMKNDYGSVMVSGGNSYVLPYVDYILEVPLDSSQFLRSSQAIPFYGMVLHGYVNFTGEALNMAGDIDYELLKAIENGSSMYFVLAYQNTDKLKENYLLQKYYSVNFQIWAESNMYDDYNRLNEALSDVQDKLIIDHEFISGIRVLTAEELAQAEADKLRQEQEESSRAEEEAKKTESTETTAPADDNTPTEDATVTDAPTTDKPDTETPTPDTPEGDKKDDEEEIDTDNIVDNGKIVKVTYEGGKTFILNYNNYKVNVDGVEIDALDFAVIAEGGKN